MSLPHLAFFIQPRFTHRDSCVRLWPLCTMIDHSDQEHRELAVRFYCCNTPMKYLPRPSGSPSSSIRVHPVEAVTLATKERESLDMSSEPISRLNLCYDDASIAVDGLACQHSEPVLMQSMEEDKETLRRRRIGLANKGKVPWNKGKKHSAETRVRIKERTLQALRDPKVRKKMSESPRSHSEQSKGKISSSLRQLWAERLKWKRSKEKFYSSWAESIAEAARKGGIDEEELSWDSYEKIKEEMACQQLQRAAEKAKEKEMKKILAEKRIQKRAEKMRWLAQRKLEHKQKAKPNAKQKRKMSCKTREEEKELAPSRDLNLEVRTTKIHGKKLKDGPSCSNAGVMNYLQSALESFDIESIRRELTRSTVSLADQIQAAKSKRKQTVACDMQQHHPVLNGMKKNM